MRRLFLLGWLLLAILAAMVFWRHEQPPVTYRALPRSLATEPEPDLWPELPEAGSVERLEDGSYLVRPGKSNKER